MKKRPYPWFNVGLVALVMMLFLVACERPIPRDDAPSAEDPNGVTDPNAIPPATLAIPPTATDPTGYPGTDVGETTGENGGTVDPAAETGAGTEGAELPTPVPGPGNPPTETVHTIGAGDTLYALSLLYDVSIEAIIEVNNLANPDDLDIGQVLIIPPPGTEATGVTQDPDSTTDPAGSGDGTTEQVHIVQAGDNLYRIGLRYGFTVAELSTYNGITNPDSLEVGQEILIPPSN